MIRSTLLILLSFSCTHMNDIKESRESWESWIGKDERELFTHPYFSTLKKHWKGHVLVLANGYPITTKARSAAFDGGTWYENWCEHYFTIEGGKIKKLEELGPCPYDERKFYSPSPKGQ